MADGLIDAAEAADVIVLVAVWVDPAAGDETAVKAANRAAMRDAIADALDAAARPTTCARSPTAARSAANAYYARRLTCASRRSRCGATGSRSTRRSAPRGTRTRAGA